MTSGYRCGIAKQLILCACLLGAGQTSMSGQAATPPALALTVYDSDTLSPPQNGGWFFTTPGADGARLWSQTRLMFGLGVVAVGLLYAMPESVTGWDRDVQIDDLPERWWRNVSDGPIWDNDHWFFNYVSHPYCGGVYYIMARKSGFNQWDSAVYTFLMSTFFWEYGIEAFAEVPSIQDLVVTPAGGWIYGEWAYRTEKRIRANGGLVLGSKALGGLSLFLLDPIDHFGVWTNRLLGRDWVLAGSVAFGTDARGVDPAAGRLVSARPRLTLGLERRF